MYATNAINYVTNAADATAKTQEWKRYARCVRCAGRMFINVKPNVKCEMWNYACGS